MSTTASEEMVNASATFPEELLAEIDERAKALDMNRSQYLRNLARRDIATANAEAAEKSKPKRKAA